MSQIVSIERMMHLCPQADRAFVEAFAPTVESHREQFGIASPLICAHFIGQCAEETGGFSRFEENLNYRSEVIGSLWPRLASRAAALAHNPEGLANAAYAAHKNVAGATVDPLGNGSEGNGNGWKYRGRGPIQITGRANYQTYSASCGLDLVAHPELAAEPESGAIVAMGFWDHNGCTVPAENDDVRGVTQKINPGFAGLLDRTKWVAKAKGIFT